MAVNIHHLPLSALPAVKRNDAVVNFPIAGAKQGTTNFKTSLTRMQAGSSVPKHSHNCEEQVTVLQGRVRFTLDQLIVECGPYDSTYISAAVPHEFTNVGEGEALVLVIYGATNVTRTFAATGETVEVGSARDTFPPPGPGMRPPTA